MTLEKLKQYCLLVRLNKPIGILLLLWPTLWALWLARTGMPNILVLIVFILGVILMRSAGCIINDFADRKVDGFVKRTLNRPLVTGRVTIIEAFILFLILILAAFLLVLLLNPFTIVLAFVGALLTVVYPFLKRCTHLPQLGLGLAFAWGVPMAFAAQTNTLPFGCWILFLAAITWPVIYDTMYAMTDRDDDIKIGVKSSAILFGNKDRIIIGLLQVFFISILVWVGSLFRLNLFYYSSLAITALLFVYQQFLIKDREPSQCFKAFLNNHWIGLIIYVGIVMSFIS